VGTHLSRWRRWHRQLTPVIASTGGHGIDWTGASGIQSNCSVIPSPTICRRRCRSISTGAHPRRSLTLQGAGVRSGRVQPGQRPAVGAAGRQPFNWTLPTTHGRWCRAEGHLHAQAVRDAPPGSTARRGHVSSGRRQRLPVYDSSGALLGDGNPNGVNVLKNGIEFTRRPTWMAS
jgi:hypothetical protein